MYGLLLMNMSEFIVNKFGDNMWKKVKEQINLEQEFIANETYPEAQLGKMGKTAMKILSLKDEEFYEGMGKYFVQLATDAGYHYLLVQLGRGIRDFFLNLDNLHDYLKFTFTKMKAPSFFIDTEDENSITLQYRTRRRGFHFYVQGQVKEISKLIFNQQGHPEKKLDCKLKKQEIVFDTAVFTYELLFENADFIEYKKAIESRKDTSMPIRAGTFFDMFPFCILFEKDMVVKNVGSALRFCIPQQVGRKLGEFWELIKPLVDFKYEVIETRMNSMFELATQDEIDKLRSNTTGENKDASDEVLELDDLEDLDKTLHIKGQMFFISEWQLMLFLACPIMKGLNNLIWSGLFINDLSMHDYSRDIMLANAQQDMEVNLAKMQLNKKIALTKSNEDKAAGLKKQNDELGYLYVPTQVSIDLIQGKTAEEISTKVDRASMMIVEIMGSSEFCSKAKPADICNFYNNVESIYDHLIKRNKCYRIDARYENLITSGAAEKGDNPVEAICNCALDLMEATKMALRDPVTKKAINIAISIETGPCIASVIGTSIPKFGLVGKPVDDAGVIILDVTANSIILGPVTKGCLPAMYKVKDFKDIAGVGMTAQLTEMDGRKPLADKDIKSIAPIEPAAKEDAKAGAEAKADGGSGGGGGGDANAAGGDGDGGGSGGGDDGGSGGDDAAPADDGSGDGGGDGGDGEVKSGGGARPVSVANQTQCCGGLKSGVCTLI